jgi:hypothetical protein
MENIRAASESVVEQRIKGKGKGKEILYRYAGEIVEGETEPVPRDPRKLIGVKKLTTSRPARNEFHEVRYEVRDLVVCSSVIWPTKWRISV